MQRFIKLVGSGSLSVQLLCVLTLASMPPVIADDGGLAGQISQSETLMFGYPSTGMSAQSRVEALETNVFGQPSSGALNVRLKKINQALGLTGSKPGETAQTAKAVSKTSTASAPKSKAKGSINLQPMTAQTDMPIPAPVRSGSADPALPPVAPKAVMSPKQLLQLGAKHFAEGNYAESDSMFRQVLVHDPNNVDALYNLGALAERRGEFGSALNFYRTALNLKPADADLKQAVASVQQQVGTGGATAVKNTDQKGPFQMPQKLGQPLMGGVFDNQQANAQSFTGTPMQASYGQQPLVGNVIGQSQANVTQPPIGLANVTQPSVGTATVKQPSAVKSVVKQGIGAGLGVALPGPLGVLHCPLCSLLTHW